MANLSWANEGIPVSYKINGVNIRDEFGVEMSMPNALMPAVRGRTSNPSQTHGEVDSGGFYGTRTFNVTGRVMATTHALFKSQMDAFTEWLQLEDNLQQFSLRGRTISGMRLEIAGHELSEPRTLLVTYSGGATISPISTAHFKARAYDFSVGFKASYPFWLTQEQTDAHRDTSAHEWIRVPKSTSELLGSAQTYPEYTLDGPLGDSSVTVATGRFGLAVRFNDTTVAESGSGIAFTETNIYGDSTVGTFHNQLELTAVGSTQGEGAGESIGMHGSASGGSGALIKLLIRTAGSLAVNPNDAQDADHFNGRVGTFGCYFKPSFDIVAGAQDSAKRNVLLNLGTTTVANNLQIRFADVSDKRVLEFRTINSAGTVQTKTNNS